MNILNYECEMSKCHDQLQKAEAELAEWKRGFEKMSESDRLETVERIHWEERFAELRDAEAWYFECRKFYNWYIDYDLLLSSWNHHGFLTKQGELGINEMIKEYECSKQQLRDLTEGEQC